MGLGAGILSEMDLKIDMTSSRPDASERRDEVIKRMLATPPKPHDPKAKKKKGREPKPAPQVDQAAKGKSSGN